MTLPTILYFSSILLTCVLTGFLAWYAWKHDQVPASRAYMRLTLSECFFALAEIFSVLSPSSTTALFWFQIRYIAGAFMGVFWFVFALEYNGHKKWLSKRLMAGLFVIPFVTQVLLWTNSLHGLWMKQEAGFTQNGIFWIADITSRLPGLGYLTHSFYTLLLTLAGIALMFVTAWKMRREFIGQALLLAGAGLTAFTFAMNSLFNFLPKTGFNPFTPGIGLSVLLIALSVFRFEFLKRAPADESAPQVTRLDTQEKYSLAVFILMFILFTSGIAAASYFTYQNYERQFSAQVENQLSAIASLKVDELQNWRNERMADASLFYRNKNFSWRVQLYLDNPQDPAIQAELLMWIEKLQAHPEYTRVFLLNPQGIELISTLDTSEKIPEDLIQQASACLASGEIKFLDFHRHSDKDIIHLSILVPIFDAQDGSRPLGVLVLMIDPNIYLYPFIQQWPVPSQSSETLLVRREGEEVLYLNRLKFEENTALNLRIPLEETQVPAVQAVLGQTGIVHGLDYRGVEVIGDARAVPDSPWFLVSKMDTAEVYAPLRARLWQTVLFFGILLLMTGAGLMLVWRQQQIRSYRGQVEAAESLIVSETRYRRLFEAARDGILILDAETGIIVNVNPFLVEMLGFPQEGFVGKELWELGFFKDIAANKDNFLELQQKKYIRYENLPLETADGRKFHVEFVSNVYQVNHHKVIQCNIRDITDRVLAEEKLTTSEVRYRRLFEAARDGILILDAETGMILDVNPFLIEMLGFSHEVFLGKALWELGFFKDIAASKSNFLELQQKEYIKYEGLPMETADGRRISVEFVSHVYQVDQHKVIQCNIRDITERKQAEKELKNVKVTLEAAFEQTLISMVLVSMPDAVLRIVNTACREFLDITDEPTPVGQRLMDFKPSYQDFDAQGNLTPLTKVPLALALQGQRIINQERKIVTKNGETRWALVSGTPIYNTHGDLIAAYLAIYDMTERKQAEEKLKEVNQDLKQAQSVAHLGNWKWNLKTSTVEWSDEMYNIFGIDKDSYTGRLGDVIKKVIHPDDLHIVLPENAAEFAGNKPREYRIIWPDGSIRHILAKAGESILDEQGNPAFLTGIAQDITERKQAEETLRESEHKYRLLFNEMSSGYAVHEIICDPGGKPLDYRFLSVNAAFERMTGLHSADVIGRTVLEVMPATEPVWIERYGQVALTREPAQFENHASALGKSFEVRAFSPEAGKFATIFNDITERKQAEEALHESEDKFKYVFENSVIGKSITQFSGGMQVNKALCDMLGYSPHEMQEKKWQEITHPDDIELTQKEIAALFSGEKESVRFEKRFIHKNGSIVWVDLSSTIRRDAQRKPLYLMSAVIDITERKRAEEALRLKNFVFDASIAANSIADMSGNITEANGAFLRVWGYQGKDEVVGKPLSHFINNPDEALAIVSALNSNGEWEGEYTARKKDGSTFFAYGLATVVKDETGKTIGYQSAVLDITDRKKTEEALADLQSLQNAIVETTDDFIFSVDSEQFRLLTFNQRTYNSFLNSRGIHITKGMSLEELYPTPDFVETWEALLNRALREGSYKTDYKGRTGPHTMELSFNLLKRNGNVYAISVFGRDITERKQAEEALRESRAILQAAMDNSPAGIAIADAPDGKLRYVNNAGLLIRGGDRQSIVDGIGIDQYVSSWQLLDLDGRPLNPDEVPLARAILFGETNSREFIVLRNSNDDRIVLGNAAPIIDERGKVTAGIVIFTDITERKQAEAALQKSQMQLQAIMDYSPALISIKDLNGNIILANQGLAVLDAPPLNEMIGKNVFDIFPKEVAEQLWNNDLAALQAKAPVQSEEVVKHKDGIWHTYWTVKFPIYLQSDQPFGICAISNDITERKRAEEVLQGYNTRLETEVEERTRELREIQEQLVRQERLATLGQLAGSIGHELRNPLGIISNAIYFLKLSQPNAGEKIKEYLDIIEKETRTSDKIITDLLDFTRIKSLDRQPVSVSELIRQALERKPAPESVDVELKIPADLPQIYVDPQHIIQVFGNLISNACQAMDSDLPNGRKLTVSAAAQGAMIKIEVQDMGVGIPPENMKKIFEPLFTTKIKGIGLGLAVSRKLTEANGGRIEVESEAGKGSTFTVYLPVYEESK